MCSYHRQKCLFMNTVLKTKSSCSHHKRDRTIWSRFTVWICVHWIVSFLHLHVKVITAIDSNHSFFVLF